MARTKENWGKGMMASDERMAYRAEQGVQTGRDYIEERAVFMAWRNDPYHVISDGRLATLGSGSKYRNIARARKSAGRPLLG